ncbi:DUF998 domain-containing protein [Falsarthrobacter nasiphocae]|uniref:Pimeloyl-ACP methyl ester carboxylesterase n=1 Tax=Falsarthrobacter nasiphocae TaxID=189863 RepID=A0AAE3YGP4_9MICC|nr:DUF998 domain-containing protein [Falsarthrobacter nasiphocae]MDR6891927.1 pimeloyl-ACP methyl ester carboxylesterase [Falsarthrobacter nasiphocae]
MQLTRASWGILIAAMALYSAWVLALGGASQGFVDPATSYVSELAAAGQPRRNAFRSTDALAGLIVAGLAIAQWPLRTMDALPDKARWLGHTALAGLILFGICTVLDAAWTMACTPSQSPACYAMQVDGSLPWTHYAHTTTSTGVGLGLSVAMVSLAAAGVVALRHQTHGTPARGLKARVWVGAVLALAALAMVIVSICMAPPVQDAFGEGPLPLGVTQRASLALSSLTLLTLLAPGPLSPDARRRAPERPSLVFHPGLGVAMDSFDDVRAALSEHHQVTWARPGMDGAPSREEGDMPGSVVDAKALLEVLDHAGPGGRPVGRAILVGHSMSGPVIETFARLYPERVAGLVFLDASIPPSGGRSKGVRRDRVARSVRRAWARSGLTRLISRASGHPDRLPNVDVENAAYPWYIEEATQVRNAKPMPDVPVEVVVAHRGVPFTGFWIRQQRDYVRLLHDTGATRARLTVVRPSGHLVQKEHPLQVAEIIRRVIRGV